MHHSYPDAALRAAILAALENAPEGLSLAKLCKRLGVRMSVLLRTLAWMGDAPIGGVAGEGLVRVEVRGELSVAKLVHAAADEGSMLSPREA